MLCATFRGRCCVRLCVLLAGHFLDLWSLQNAGACYALCVGVLCVSAKKARWLCDAAACGMSVSCTLQSALICHVASIVRQPAVLFVEAILCNQVEQPLD